MKRAVVLVAAVAAVSAFAEDYVWNGGASGEWTQAANWLPNTGYPDGADDTAAFTPSAATEVTIGSAVTVQGITVDGTSALTITGEAITLGSGGLTSTSTAAVGISNNLVIATAATPLAVNGPATLAAATPAGPLHLGGVISGAGGIAKTGSGALHLYGANTFTGDFTSEGNSKRPDGTAITSATNGKSYTKDGSSEVFIYDGAALGAGTATFDSGAGTGNIKGSRLTVAGPMTVTTDLVLSGDYADGNGSMKFAVTGVYRFKGTVSSPFRLRVGCPDNVEVHYEKKVSCSNWHTNDKIGSTGVFNIYYEGTLNVSLLNGSGNYSHVYLMTTGNSFSQSGALTMHCGVENAYPATRSGVWRWNSNYMKLDLGGYDQKITSISGYEEKANQHGFLSATPAKVRFVGVGSNFSFGGCFYDAAGLEWDPQNAARTLTLTNKTAQTTVGDLVAKSGVLRLSNGITFTRLGHISVGASGTFSAGAGAEIFATNVVMETGAKFVLESGRTIRCIHASVDGTPLADGRYDADSTEVDIEGNGVLVVDSTQNIWDGGATGSWSDPANWSLGMVPQAGQSATLPAGCTVTLAESTPRLKEVVVAVGATLVASNWATCVNADRVSVAGTVTATGPFTNELHKSRVWISCGDLEVAASGKIDVAGKGWKGGVNGVYALSYTNYAARAGWGPGGVSTGYNGASHMGLGGYPSYYSYRLSRTYDDPFAPVEPGSGGYGMNYTSVQTPDGGGAVRIEATGAVVMNGSILADGDAIYAIKAGTSSNDGDTGASGGSVWITCGCLSGSGTISATGGDGKNGIYQPNFYAAEGGTSSPSLAGAGGGVRVEYNASRQTAEMVSGMTISAAGGICHGKVKLTWPIMDRYCSEAEPGTLTFTDDKLVTALIGNGLCGRIMGIQSYTHPGDLDWSYGHVRFAATGVTVNVTGNLTITGGSSRLDVGGVYKRIYATRPYVVAGDSPVALNVGGDLVVSNGAAFAVYAAATNATDGWGGVVTVGGAFSVGSGGFVYPVSDYVNTGSPRFRAGSFTVEEGGLVDANGRGGSGAWSAGVYQARYGGEYALRSRGCGIGAGNNCASSGHGGAGAVSYIDTSVFSGRSKSATAGVVCDDPYRPTLPGAGGGAQGYGYPGDGGGIFFLESPGAIRVDGTIRADGWWGVYYSDGGYMYQFGSGAGGTVFLGGATFTAGANARLSARGGDSWQTRNDGADVSATGGGGRIAVQIGYGRELAGEHSAYIHTQDRNRVDLTNAGFSFLGVADASGGTNRYVTTTHVEPPASALGGDGTVWFTLVRPPFGVKIIVR